MHVLHSICVHALHSTPVHQLHSSALFYSAELWWPLEQVVGEETALAAMGQQGCHRIWEKGVLLETQISFPGS